MGFDSCIPPMVMHGYTRSPTRTGVTPRGTENIVVQNTNAVDYYLSQVLNHANFISTRRTLFPAGINLNDISLVNGTNSSNLGRIML